MTGGSDLGPAREDLGRDGSGDPPVIIRKDGRFWVAEKDLQVTRIWKGRFGHRACCFTPAPILVTHVDPFRKHPGAIGH